MTATRETASHPGRDRLGVALACFVWALVLATAAIEVTLLAPIVPKGSVSVLDEIDFYVSGATFQAVWVLSLLAERAHRHNRRRIRRLRRTAWVIQACFLTLLTLGTWHSVHAYNGAAGALFLALAMMLWHARASSEALHPDDQKVVDQTIEEEERLLNQHRQTEVSRLREARLTEALNSVRRFTVVDPTPEPATPQPPSIEWDIPKGTHTPVVYFIRNGNRIKIGTTTDLHQRVRRLSLRFEDVALVLPGGRDVERSKHRQFASVRVGNSEWFRDEQPLHDFITNQVDRRTPTSTKGSDSHE